jgi:GMP synthase-like glutamine amidotransferase
MHKDIVYGYPSGTEELGETAMCLNQGMYIKGRLITVQGHPEFTHDIVEEIVNYRHAVGIFSDELFEDAVKRLPDHDDGVIVAQAFFRFLLED